MAGEKITVEFKDGKKITKYPGGKVSEQTQEDLERYKDFLTRERQRIDRHISLIDDDLSQITASKKAK
ncbi:MAG: hypothetical protein C4533_07785 [Candidatus Omnitrophota bacterium]|jgi:hypothetical protein|nr:MAG: hypothetical protein C4533_07785 [Candidatus Omnitrophota bacterium]